MAVSHTGMWKIDFLRTKSFALKGIFMSISSIYALYLMVGIFSFSLNRRGLEMLYKK